MSKSGEKPTGNFTVTRHTIRTVEENGKRGPELTIRTEVHPPVDLDPEWWLPPGYTLAKIISPTDASAIADLAVESEMLVALVAALHAALITRLQFELRLRELQLELFSGLNGVDLHEVISEVLYRVCKGQVPVDTALMEKIAADILRQR